MEAATQPLLYTCEGCGADFDEDDMKKVIQNSPVVRGALRLTCDVCGSVGRFVDGPDV